MSWRPWTACGIAAVAGGVLLALWSGGMEEGDPLADAPPFLPDSLAARSLDGEKVDFRAPDSGVLVAFFYADGCDGRPGPPAGAVELAKSWPAHRVLAAAIRVDPGPAGDATTAGFPVIPDPAHELARAFRVRSIPEAIAIDDRGRLRFRGNPGDGGAVREAVAAILAGEPAPAPRADGDSPSSRDLSEFSARGAAPGPPTYNGEVAAILRRSCQACHRPGGAGPFSLLTHAQAAKRADDLADVAEGGLMPPWKPTPGFGPPLLHDRTLLPREIGALRAWADAGAPEGDGEPPPPIADPPGGWELGEPDLVVEMPEDFAIPPAGDDVYRCFVMPTALPADRFITAMEVRPGNPRVVHHTFSYVDNRGIGRGRDAEDAGPGYMCFSGFTGDQVFGAMGGWTPGNEPHPFGEGIGLHLPRGVDVVMQVHYHPSGKPERDRTRIGLHLAKGPVRRALQWISACANPETFELPAGDPDIRIRAELTLPMDVDLHAMTPHMHLLGRSLRAEVRLPDGRIRPLIAIDDWDFNRQDTYYLREPLRLPKDATILLEGRFDNSEGNPRNPSRPPEGVRWGEATTDDMMILFLALTRVGQDLTRPGASDTFMEEFFGKPDGLPDVAR
jgi:mono/diheme cytochrome c family protein